MAPVAAAVAPRTKAFNCDSNCVNHRSQTAFHVRRAATEQICTFDTWLKLIAALRGNHIVVTAEIE